MAKLIFRTSKKVFIISNQCHVLENLCSEFTCMHVPCVYGSRYVYKTQNKLISSQTKIFFTLKFNHKVSLILAYMIIKFLVFCGDHFQMYFKALCLLF